MLERGPVGEGDAGLVPTEALGLEVPPDGGGQKPGVDDRTLPIPGGVDLGGILGDDGRGVTCLGHVGFPGCLGDVVGPET